MKALIFGISGQDGAHLSKFLLGKSYKVFGTSRNVVKNNFNYLKKMNIKNDIEFSSVDLTDFKSVLKHISIIKPEEIYNLAGQTSVGLSFQQPIEALESVANVTLNILEAIRATNPNIKFYNASSSECFGDTGEEAANEEIPFSPCSPYGIDKATTQILVKNYPVAHKLYACNGILFNHESPTRPKHFVTQKIVYSAARINAGNKEKLKMGNKSYS